MANEKQIELQLQNIIGGDQAPELGPGCCVVNAGRVTYRVSNCGNRELCDRLAVDLRGNVVSYVQGTNCT